MVPVPPAAGVLHENGVPVVCDSETNVVFAGTASVSETLDAADGPLFVSVIVYVMSVPAVEVAGPLLLMVRSADADTVAGAVWLLLFKFGSAFVPLKVAVLLSSPLNALWMSAMRLIWADAPAASACNKHFTDPGVFGAGMPQVAV